MSMLDDAHGSLDPLQRILEYFADTITEIQAQIIRLDRIEHQIEWLNEENGKMWKQILANKDNWM